MEKWDQKEKEIEESVVKTFKLYDSKQTCPMCELVRKNDMLFGSDTAKCFFLDTYEERIHDKQGCFIESYLYCMSARKLMITSFDVAQKKAVNQFNIVQDFVKWKEKH